MTQKAPCLKSFGVHGLKFSDDSLQLLATGCRHLSALSLRGCSFTRDDFLHAVSSWSLRYLDLYGQHFGTHHNPEAITVTALARQCPQLTALSLERAFYDERDVTEGLRTLPQLNTLNVSDRFISTNHYKGDDMADVTGFALELMALVPCLRVLDIRQGHSMGHSAMPELRQFQEENKPDLALYCGVDDPMCPMSQSGPVATPAWPPWRRVCDEALQHMQGNVTCS